MTFRTLLALALPFAVACGGTATTTTGSTTAPASYDGPVTSTDVALGQQVWAGKCASCHTEQDGAYGPRVAGGNDSPAEMRRQVREGSGRMPGFGESQISSAELEALLAYLQTNGGVAR